MLTGIKFLNQMLKNHVSKWLLQLYMQHEVYCVWQNQKQQ